ncbi:MAG: DUF309 domain-containing protein [Gemmataceae bacterium]|nr:DUF309 domain-containing protein [Gemmataceae bacterium]
MPPQAREGIERFNRREFYACHESLEEAWLAEQRPVRRLYRGILQVGVGFYHAGRENWDGAIKLLESGLENLAAWRPVCQGVDVEALYQAAERALAELHRLGPDRLRELDASFIPTIRLVDAPA